MDTYQTVYKDMPKAKREMAREIKIMLSLSKSCVFGIDVVYYE
ncbi:hypothetical protein [Oceanobacillus caeni]|nr:hypothetical protein [Oceanobacillus caeni]